MRAKYIKVNRNTQQSAKTQKKNKQTNKSTKKKNENEKKNHLKKTINRQTLQTCRNIKKTQNNT